MCQGLKGTTMENTWCLILERPTFDLKINNKQLQNKYRNTNNVDMWGDPQRNEEIIITMELVGKYSHSWCHLCML